MFGDLLLLVALSTFEFVISNCLEFSIFFLSNLEYKGITL
jgi:hypothetical protein